jgi:protein-tyrosine-phosphatase/ribosomal protein S27AE
MFDNCPGAAQFTRTPTLKIKKCPECGEDAEIFSTELKVNCSKCGFTIYNDLGSCIQWCKYAKECVGEEVYNSLKIKTVAFLCIGNASRSQIAEALASKLCPSPKLRFISAGTQPADEIDSKTQQVLEEEGIAWQGKPKKLSDKEGIDVVVTVGCGVECPVVPGAKVIAWDIPDPKGKDIGEFRRVLSMIKHKILELLEEME